MDSHESIKHVILEVGLFEDFLCWLQDSFSVAHCENVKKVILVKPSVGKPEGYRMMHERRFDLRIIAICSLKKDKNRRPTLNDIFEHILSGEWRHSENIYFKIGAWF